MWTGAGGFVVSGTIAWPVQYAILRSRRLKFNEKWIQDVRDGKRALPREGKHSLSEYLSLSTVSHEGSSGGGRAVSSGSRGNGGNKSNGGNKGSGSSVNPTDPVLNNGGSAPPLTPEQEAAKAAEKKRKELEKEFRALWNWKITGCNDA